VVVHDLLTPLHAILTTARLLTMRSELHPRALVAVARIVSSGVRMQRMVEQVRDIIQFRQVSAFCVTKDAQHDLAPLVSKVVHEIRAVNPGCSLDFDEATSCRARVDGDRFEQVASNLIGNAVVHGDTKKPIAIALEATEDWISFSVHNYGPAIKPDQLPLLFEPFKQSQSRESHCQSAGLGLGLYITDCIVRAHGGRIRVTSSPELGTQFCALLPAD
jgi:signal transduction histidine kinase